MLTKLVKGGMKSALRRPVLRMQPAMKFSTNNELAQAEDNEVADPDFNQELKTISSKPNQVFFGRTPEDDAAAHDLAKETNLKLTDLGIMNQKMILEQRLKEYDYAMLIHNDVTRHDFLEAIAQHKEGDHSEVSKVKDQIARIIQDEKEAMGFQDVLNSEEKLM